jgi:hypothetical protein
VVSLGQLHRPREEFTEVTPFVAAVGPAAVGPADAGAPADEAPAKR